MEYSQLSKKIDYVIEAYVTGSRIKEITYSVIEKKWIVTFNYNVEPCGFDNFEEMVTWFHDDQFTD